MISTTVKIGKAMATATDRHNDSRQQRLTVFYKAVEMVKAARQWPSGENRSVFEGTLGGRKASVHIRNETSSGRGQAGLNLYLFVEGPGGNMMKRFFSQPFRIGYFHPEAGFTVSENATEANYLRWNLETRKSMG